MASRQVLHVTIGDWVVALLLALVPLVFLRDALEPFQTVKATVLVVGAATLVCALVASRTTMQVAIRREPAFAALLATFLLVAVAATAFSSWPRIAIHGDHAHSAGLVMYVALAVVAIAAISGADGAVAVRLWLRALTVSVGTAAAYALLQAAGGDPFVWVDIGLTGTASTLGQQNFASGFLGAAAPAVAGLAPLRRERPGWRVAGGMAAVLAVAALPTTRSFQGVVALVAGTLLLGLTLGVDLGQRLDRGRRRQAIVGLAVVIAALGVVAVTLRARLAGLVEQGLEERRYFWTAAADLIREHPVLGTGPDTFGLYFPTIRPAEHASRFLGVNAEAPHNVPLAMFSNGGTLLGVAYLAFCAYVAYRLVRGLVQVDGERRLLLGSVGALWLGYQVQSLVSIDVPSLALLHFVASGAIIALSRPPQAVPGRKRAARAPAVGAPVLVALALAVVVVWTSSGPLRADIHAGRGLAAAQAGDADQAQRRMDRAVEIAPYRGIYWYLQANLAAARMDLPTALRAATAAAERDPGNATSAMLAGNLAYQLGDDAAAADWFREAATRDPHNAEIADEVDNRLRDLEGPPS
jgi:O-antigen ligase